jgi:hypothetical protein
MQRLSAVFLAFILCLAVFAPPAQAATPPPLGKPPGIAAAETLSQVTGIAISPLLGVGAVGAWRYFETPAAQRHQLSWYAQPWFWGPALLLVGLCFIKDTAGTALPTALKKPFDVLEVFENKLSGLIATGAIVPMALDMFKQVAPDAQASLSGAGFAAIDLAPLWGALLVPFALLAYGVVFFVSHAINILILISPFSVVDAALKSFRLFLLSTVAGTSLLSPKLGAVWAGLIILACLPLAGWAFRLTIFGHVFAWDILTLRRRRFTPDPAANPVFLARSIGPAPRRTYGILRRDASGQLIFSYRPWLVLPARQVALPAAQLAVGRGLLHPELLIVEGDSTDDILNLPPRFKSHEAEFGQAYGVTDVRDVGLRAAWSWLRSLFDSTPAPSPRGA